MIIMKMLQIVKVERNNASCENFVFDHKPVETNMDLKPDFFNKLSIFIYRTNLIYK